MENCICLVVRRDCIGLQDVLRVAGVGVVIAFIHLFFEHTGKKEYAFFIFFVAYVYLTLELLRFLQFFLRQLMQFFDWLTNSGLA